MKKSVLFVLMVLVSAKGSLVLAQQKPHYTQYILNQYIVNPALTGIENYTDVKLSHRHQWVGIQDAPVTSYFTIHSPIGKQDFRTTATSFETPGENPRGKNYWEDYTAASPHHGVGLQIIRDVTGPLSNTSAYATYAYHLGLSPQTSLAAGFGVGFNNYSLDANKIQFYGSSPFRLGYLCRSLYYQQSALFLHSLLQRAVPPQFLYSRGIPQHSAHALLII